MFRGLKREVECFKNKLYAWAEFWFKPFRIRKGVGTLGLIRFGAKINQKPNQKAGPPRLKNHQEIQGNRVNGKYNRKLIIEAILLGLFEEA